MYKNIVPQEVAEGMERVLQKIDQAAFQSNSTYWATAGTSIGALLHHTRIPWDDDIDIYVLRQDRERLLAAFDGIEAFDRMYGKIWKVFEPNAPRIRGRKWTWPAIDLFPVDCDDEYCTEGSLENRVDEMRMPKASIFPLKRRPFGRLSLPFPCQLQKVVEDRYSPRVRDNCAVGAFIHSKEKFDRSRRRNEKCTDLHFYPTFTHVQVQTPWPSHPQFTVEHLMDGAETVLSSVTFDQGHEVRRSYADGLIGVNDSAISFTIPAHPFDVRTGDQHQLRPVPFLQEERQSYLRNHANRSAEILNLEVLPMLNRIEVSNKYVETPPKSVLNVVVNVVVWNAERGTNYDVLPAFAPNPDILILNEMDWGMARSGNVHTTPLLADQLQMIYAYGVEFMELTNGNSAEINATLDQINQVGYHGNVVMSKWRILESKVVRLHELYDHLYMHKTEGMDRRLGGRMVLFAVTQMAADKKILVVSAHGHGGAPKAKLQGDAQMICREIKSFPNITAVFVGGDVAGSLSQELQKTCQTLPLDATNTYWGRRAQPTWRVTCPNGEKPCARFERGDWLIGMGDSLQVVNDTVKTIHPYKMLPDGKYDCISDHSIIMFDAEKLSTQQRCVAGESVGREIGVGALVGLPLAIRKN